MRCVRFAAPCVHFLPVELEKHIRMVNQAVMGEQIFRFIFVEADIPLIVQTVLASEIRDPALCGNTRSTEENNMVTESDDFVQCFNFIVSRQVTLTPSAAAP